MAHKEISYILQGMKRDLSPSISDPKFSFENHNIRFITNEDSSGLVATTERGPLKRFEGIMGIPIGSADLDDCSIIFTINTKHKTSLNYYKDYIYKISLSEEPKCIYKGDLNFDINNPIDTLSYYETDKIRKVYWTDGKNSLRVLNVDNEYTEDTDFNFIGKIESKEVVVITKNESGGIFAPGVIQYVCTYYNLYGHESNIFYTSPLYYTSFNDRGGSPEDKVSNSFTINIYNVDTKYDFIRVYSIFRSSIDATPEVKRVIDIPTNNYELPELNTDYIEFYYNNRSKYTPDGGNSSLPLETFEIKNNDILYFKSDPVNTLNVNSPINFISSNYINIYKSNFKINGLGISITDTGNIGDSEDPTILLYLGGEDITAQTITQKDNTLFLGNISLNRKNIDELILSKFRDLEENITFDTMRKYELDNPKGTYYSHTNLLNFNSNRIKTFKYRETYRFGIQLQDKTGKWTEPIYIGDKQNDKHIIAQYCKIDATQNRYVLAPYAKLEITSQELVNYINENYIAIRPVIVYPEIADRECLCQGFLSPTVFNIGDRVNNSPTSQSSWYCRPNIPYDYNDTMKTEKVNIPIAHNASNTAPINADVYIPLERNRKNRNGIWGDYNGESILDNDGTIKKEYKYIIGNNSKYSILYNAAVAGNLVGVTYSNGSIENQTWYFGYNIRPIEGFVENGYWEEFRHYYPLGSCRALTESAPKNAENRYAVQYPWECDYNAEIQCMHTPDAFPTIGTTDFSTELQKRVENFYVDQSIVTFHSPELEFDDNYKNLDLSNYKLRIVGIIPLTSNIGDMDVQTETPPYLSGNSKCGKFFTKVQNYNISNKGYKALITFPGWIDGRYKMYSYEEWAKEYPNDYEVGDGYYTYDNYLNSYLTLYVLFPWHRNGSLNNTPQTEDGYRTAKLKQKKMSNLRYSYNSFYFNYEDFWSPENGVSDIQLFDSDEITMLKLKGPEYSDLDNIIYYGNIDKVLINDDPYPLFLAGSLYTDPADNKQPNRTDLTNKINDKNAGMAYKKSYSRAQAIKGATGPEGDKTVDKSGNPGGEYYKQGISTDPVSMKYKSTAHAVIPINYTKEFKQVILPTLTDGYLEGNGWKTFPINKAIIYNNNGNRDIYTNFKGNRFYPEQIAWRKDASSPSTLKGVIQDVLDIDFSNYNGTVPDTKSRGPEFGWLWLAELYNDNVKNRFGGTSEDALSNNKWLICGHHIPIDNSSNSITVYWTDGDTYYQRYDHLKTYPFTLEDQNSITEIVSFMCETRVNLDGRYDKNRGNKSNLAITPKNFNLLNPVYSQSDNFFINRYINKSLKEVNDFPNSITWTKTKQPGEIVDTWTNITLASTLNLDGLLGNITSLQTFNNSIYAFQPKGISQILYNERVQIPTSDNVPVEIGNSAKVGGYRYLSLNCGCSNKWSICPSFKGLYFIDDRLKNINILNSEGIVSLSDNFGFHTYANDKIKYDKKWTPIGSNTDSVKTYYDQRNKDILFMFDDTCLAFSEYTNSFTSFYDYTQIPVISHIGNDLIMYKQDRSSIFVDKCDAWLHNQGSYNIFFGEYKTPFIEILCSPNPKGDKIFNNIEFRADTFDNNENLLDNKTFDTLEVHNEYQSNEISLVNTAGKPSSLKKKFRIWRANIPRDRSNNRDRIRNPWTYIKLAIKEKNFNKTALHNLTVHYFE